MDLPIAVTIRFQETDVYSLASVSPLGIHWRGPDGLAGVDRIGRQQFQSIWAIARSGARQRIPRSGPGNLGASRGCRMHGLRRVHHRRQMWCGDTVATELQHVSGVIMQRLH